MLSVDVLNYVFALCSLILTISISIAIIKIARMICTKKESKFVEIVEPLKTDPAEQSLAERLNELRRLPNDAKAREEFTRIFQNRYK